MIHDSVAMSTNALELPHTVLLRFTLLQTTSEVLQFT